MHDTVIIEWDIKIPTASLTLTLYSFFLESSTIMQRYNFSEHPKTKYYFIGLNASLTFHAYKIFLVSVLNDSDETIKQKISV